MNDSSNNDRATRSMNDDTKTTCLLPTHNVKYGMTTTLRPKIPLIGKCTNDAVRQEIQI